jgi:hypothetical protein
MRLRVITFIIVCTTASWVAFSFGIWVARGSQGKIGPGAEEQGVAHAKSVRLILPGTLDGQSIPGRGSRSADHGRELSPIYPTLEPTSADRTVSEGVAEAARTADAQRDQASSMPGEAPDFTQAVARQGAHDTRVLRHGKQTFAPWPRASIRTYARRERYFAAPRARSGNPFALFARLLSQ